MTAPVSYSMQGAVDASGLSRSTLQRAIRSRQLPAKRSSRDEDGNPIGALVIKRSDLEAFIDGLVDAA